MDKFPLHNRTHFYKYTSINTAKCILKSKKFRYSSPILFNDPFDVQTELLSDFDLELYPQKLFNEIEKLASSDIEIEYQGNHPWKEAIDLLRFQVKTEGEINPKLKEGLLAIISPLIKEYEKLRDDYNINWRKTLKAMRVFSMSIRNDNILLWSHYGQNHTGIVFKLKVLPEFDNLFCIAEPIIYKPFPLTFFTLQDWIKDTLGIEKLKDYDLFHNYAKIKFDLWQYEDEWRVWSYDWDSIEKSYYDSDSYAIPKELLYNDYAIIPEEIECIYFGCNSSEDDITAIKNLGCDLNKSIKYYKTKKVVGKYTLEFEEI